MGMPTSALNERFWVETTKGSYEFFGDFSFDKDAQDCMGTGSLKMPYDPQLWAFWEPGFTNLKIYGGTFDNGKLFEGRTREIQQDGEYITIKIQDCGWRLKQDYDNSVTEKTVAKAFAKIVKKAGMKPIILGLSKTYVIPDEEGSNGEETDGTTTSSDIGPYNSSPATASTASQSSKFSYTGLSRQAIDNALLSASVVRAAPIIKQGASNAMLGARASGISTKTLVSAPPQKTTKGILTVSAGTSQTSKKYSYDNSATAEESTAEEEVEEPEEKGTYEDALTKLCEDADEENLIWYTNQNNECVLVDFYSLFTDIKSKAFIIENWMMEYPSFNLNVNQFGFATSISVKYKNGTIKESYDDLVLVFGDKVKTFTKKNLNKKEAQNFALRELGKALRDFALEIQVNILHTHKINPGSFVTITNPKTQYSETYFVSGININHSPEKTLTCSLSLKYAPENPLVDEIPEIQGTKEDVMTFDQIGKQAAKTKYNVNHGNQSTIVGKANPTASCYGMSDFLYHGLVGAGYRARILHYPHPAYGTHRHTEYYKNGKWVDFPYSKYGISKQFWNYLKPGQNPCIVPNHGDQYSTAIRVCVPGRDANIRAGGDNPTR